MSSALMPYNFTILDTSPLFQYLPSQDGPIATSWNATFSRSSDATWVPESLGVGESSHRTTLAGASVQLDWIGTAIYLYGNASAGGYTTRLDGTQRNVGTNVPGLLFAQSGLSYGSHSLVLQVVQGAASIFSAIITVGMGETGTTIQNYSIITTSVPLTTNDIVLSGTWYTLHIPYGINGPLVPRIATNTKGSSISFPLTSANAFYIVGHVNFNHGPYHVTLTPPSDLGPPQTVYYNGSSRWVGLNTTKYLATGLDRTRTYQVDLVNDSDLYYDMSEIVVFYTPPTSSAPPTSSQLPNSTSGDSHTLGTGAIAGVAVGSAFGFLVLSMFLFCIYRRRQRPTSQPNNVMTDSEYNLPPALVSPVPHPSTPASAELPRLLPNTQGILPYSANAPTQVPSTPPYSQADPQPAPTIPLSQAGRLSHLSPTAFTTPDVSPSTPPVLEATSQTRRPDVAAPGNLLTPEDARFFNNLYSLNVPAADIAIMMETMRAEREAANRIEGSSRGAVHVPPPEYDFKA